MQFDLAASSFRSSYTLREVNVVDLNGTRVGKVSPLYKSLIELSVNRLASACQFLRNFISPASTQATQSAFSCLKNSVLSLQGVAFSTFYPKY